MEVLYVGRLSVATYGWNDLLLRVRDADGAPLSGVPWTRVVASATTRPLFLQLDAQPTDLAVLLQPQHRLWMYGDAGTAYAAFHLGGERPQLRLADRPELSTLDFFRPPSAAAGPAEECQGESMRTVRILAPRSAAARAAALGEPRVRMAGRRARALRV